MIVYRTIQFVQMPLDFIQSIQHSIKNVVTLTPLLYLRNNSALIIYINHEVWMCVMSFLLAGFVSRNSIIYTNLGPTIMAYAVFSNAASAPEKGSVI